MKTLRLPALFSNFILIIALLGIWIAFAPVNLGGRTSYVIVNGISMEPGYHMGDLTIIRKAANYQVGDIVTYNDARMNAYVIHRIIGVDNDKFILQGDNNSWVDAYYPTREEIIGKVWIHIPKIGKLFKWLRSPLNLAVTLSLLGGVLMSGMIFMPSKKRKMKPKPPGNVGGTHEGSLYVSGVAAVIFLSLSILAFLRPLTRTAENIQITQQGQFSYSATGTALIYDTEVIRSGEPVFPHLTCFVNIGFAYKLLGNNVGKASGSYQLIARIMEEQTGWQRTIPMSGITAFSGNSFSTTSTLDICQIVTLVKLLEQETGLRAGRYMLEVIPQVTMTANAMGIPVSSSFEPKLTFHFDDVSFSLVTPNGQEDPLISSQQQSITNPAVETNTVSILNWNPSILTMRIVALLGLALSIGGLVITGLHMHKVTGQSADSLIRLRYGSLLVNAHDQNVETSGPLINVDSVEELAKLAERHNTVILHTTFNSLHSYLVQCNGNTYRYVTRSTKPATYDIEPVHRALVRPVYAAQSDPILQAETEQNELIGYVLSKRRTERAEVEETVIMRKIQL